MSQKPYYEPNKAIKTPLKLFVMGFFIFFGLLFVNSHILASYLSENFEAYDVGQDILALPNWRTETSAPVDYMEVISSPVYSGSRGTIFNKSLLAPNHIISYDFKASSTIAEGSLSVAFRTTGTSGSVDGFAFLLTNPAGTTGYLHFGYDIGNFGQIKYKSNNSWFLLGNYTGNTWFKISMEWQVIDGVSSQIRYKLNSGSWTDWVATPTNAKISPSYLYFQYYRWLNTKYWYIDDISVVETCSPTNCGACTSWANCVIWEECFWDFDYSYCLPYEWCCGCGFEYEKCLFCDSQAECEEVENCYWYENFCWYEGEQCGADLNCQFCETEETCETEGCYWYGDFCWQEEPPAISSWATWYDNYGDYENPAPLVNTLATGSQSFFEAIGGFLITFQKTFDLQVAFQNGKNLGEVLPKARGYLAILDSFTGKLPIGTIFMFVIMFMLAIGVFRISRALIQLIKFW